jgi:predicted TIM-barrel fold metal-dependent hydrolase
MRSRRRLIILLVILLTIGLSVAWLRSGEPAAIAAPKTVLDLHVHTAGIGAGGSGCFVSAELRNGYKFFWYLRAFGTSVDELERRGDTVVIGTIARRVAASLTTAKAVVLALDGAVDRAGELDREETQVYVPNEFVAAAIRRHPELLFGASVNPYRRDAIERLERARQDGAVLVKWIPSIMHIDPSDPALRPFYSKLKELDLPLLVHVGDENSFGEARNELGDPMLLELPLEQGVTVIAAHVATTGTNQGTSNFERLLPMFRQYPNLYTEVSSLTQINKLGYLYTALDDEVVAARMLHGSDWPLQFFPLVSPWFQIGRVPLATLRAVSHLENQWDRDVALKRAMGVPDGVFARTWEILERDRSAVVGAVVTQFPESGRAEDRLEN